MSSRSEGGYPITRTTLKLLPLVFLIVAAGALIASSGSSDADSVHSASFEVNGGSGTEDEWLVMDGGSIELPTSMFTRTGFYLSGWTDSSGGEHEPGESVTITEDLVFTAQWTELPKDADLIVDAEKELYVGQEYTFTAPTSNRPDDESPWYEWYYFTTGDGGVSVEIEEISVPGWLTLTRDSDSHSNVFTGTPQTPGVYLIEYKCTLKTSSTVQSERSSTVCWVVTVHSGMDTVCTIDFDTKGGDGTITSVSGPRGTVVELPGEGSSEKDGYSLAGWDIPVTEGTPMFALGSYFTLDGDYTATAHWLADANVVIFDGSGQIGNQIDAFVGYNEEVISLPEEGYEKDGHTFAGWRLTSDPNSIYAPGFLYTINGPTYMTAYYIENGSDTAQVTFDSNGGVGTLTQTVEIGMYVVLPDRGFSNTTDLDGWTDTDGESHDAGDVVPITGDTVFSAVWSTEVPDVVTVSFDLAGGSGSSATQILAYGDKAQRPADPVKSASVFTGWYVVGGGEYSFDKPVTSSITLRAGWEDHFSRSYDDGVVIIRLAEKYANAPTTVDWGDGTQTSGTISFTHVYKTDFSGTVTVMSSFGVSGQQVVSSVLVNVSAPPTVPDDTHEDTKEDLEDGGAPAWVLVACAAILCLIIFALVVRS